MARLIDANALKNELERVHCSGCNNYNEVRCRACMVDDCLSAIDDIPTQERKLTDQAAVNIKHMLEIYEQCQGGYAAVGVGKYHIIITDDEDTANAMMQAADALTEGGA